MDTDAEGSPTYPSGETQDDLNVYTLKGMFKYTHSQLTKQEKHLVLIDTDSAMPASASTSLLSYLPLRILMTLLRTMWKKDGGFWASSALWPLAHKLCLSIMPPDS
jgi:ligand-binding sensor domain-containing protein